MSGALASGAELHAFAAELYPLCRSITGNGLRQTLRAVASRLPLKLHEVASGTRVFDWEVPDEWNIESATLTGPDGRTVADFSDSNLHLLNYSTPASGEMTLEELAPHLYSDPRQPDLIPYRTSYYRRQWGFCLPHRVREQLKPGTYRYDIRGSLKPGALTFGECVIRGTERREFLLFTHCCHPSLANDNLSGIVLLTALGQWLRQQRRRHTYRLVFAPGTIGSLCWLKARRKQLRQIHLGLVVGLLGDSGTLTYKASRDGNTPIDALARHVLPGVAPDTKFIDFSPYGYDERQLCSPGFNLPVGRLTRSVNDGYPEYHSSGDNLQLLRADSLDRSLEALQQLVLAAEANRSYRNCSPYGEPRLGKRGLYGALGGNSPRDTEMAMLWILNQSDGSQSLLDIARKSGLPLSLLDEIAIRLEQSKLLRRVRR